MIEDMINKEIERVKGEVIPTKRKVRKVPGLITDSEPTAFQKLKRTFFEEDFGTVKSSVINDIIVPTTKNLFADILIGAIERAFYGSSKRPSRSGYTDYSSGLVRTHTASGTNYNVISKREQTKEKEIEPHKKISIDDLIYPDRPAAQDLADAINGEIHDHGTLSVNELYEMITPDNEAPPIDYTGTYYGWKEECAHVKPHGRFFRVVLPKPVQLG